MGTTLSLKSSLISVLFPAYARFAGTSNQTLKPFRVNALHTCLFCSIMLAYALFILFMMTTTLPTKMPAIIWL